MLANYVNILHSAPKKFTKFLIGIDFDNINLKFTQKALKYTKLGYLGGSFYGFNRIIPLTALVPMGKGAVMFGSLKKDMNLQQ